MAQYGILVYPPAPADPTAITSGGTGVTGFAFRPGTTATSIRGDVVRDGPFHAGHPVMAGFLVVEAPDLDVALGIARASRATRDGGAEVRPLVEPPAG